MSDTDSTLCTLADNARSAIDSYVERHGQPVGSFYASNRADDYAIRSAAIGTLYALVEYIERTGT